MKQSLTFRFIASLLICCLSADTSFGQNTFQKAYGSPEFSDNGATSVIAISDGYVMAGGAFSVSNNSHDAFLMKITLDGAILWQRTYGLTPGIDGFYHVVEANDGGFLAIGESSGFANGPTDLILIKTDANGNLLWQKHVGNTDSNLSEDGYYILPVTGGYIISGTARTKTGAATYNRGLMLRIDNNGDAVWSQLYSSGASETRFLTAQYTSGDTLFACGHRDSSGIFALINATTGSLMSMWSFDGPDVSNKTLRFMAEASNGDFLLAGYSGSVISTANQTQWVCRVSRLGDLVWSKTYSNIGRGSITPLSDEHFLLVTIPSIGERDPILVKIDGNGDVVWSYKYGKTGKNALNGNDVFGSAIETPDGGILAIGAIVSPIVNRFDVLAVKTDKNGRVEGCCSQPFSTAAVPYQAISFPSSFTQSAFFNPMDFTLPNVANDLTALEFCPPGLPEQLSSDIFICPGDSVLIGGIAYFAPGTVIDTLPGSSCDTVVTYTIQYTDLGGASVVNIQCPANQVVQVAAGTDSAVINYDTPSAQSDCLCPGIELTQVQGLPSGSDFAVGIHDICFQGQDSCGNSSECCFQISIVEDESACDVKTNGCTKFELLRITRDAAWRRTYHIRVTNNCPQPLVYAAFQVPSGVVAYAPANNATYTAPSGRPYKVRNPNYSPFYSVRYSSQNAGIQGGASDVFRYTLPPQSAPDYILSIVKRGDQTYTQAHLNTFYCPVEFDPNSQRPTEERSAVALNDVITLFPNPASDVLFADLKTLSGSTAEIRIFSAQGNLIFAKQTEIDKQTLRIDLPAGMVSGLYLFEVLDSGGQRQVKRFVLH